MVHIFGEFSFTLDKMTISLTLGLVTMANQCLGLDSFLILITWILLAGGLIQMALIFWCCLSFCSTRVRTQAITQIKIQRVSFGIFVFAGVSFFICEVLALCEWIGFRRLKISLPTLEQPMLLSLDSYSSDPEIAKSWNQLQVVYQCCGVHNYSDWYRVISPNSVPDSCCKQLTVGCGQTFRVQKIFIRWDV